MRTIDFLIPINIKYKVRFGNNFDGGYVLFEKNLSNIDALITYGVGWDIKFEEDFNLKYKKKVFMFDPTMFGRTLFDFKKFFALLMRYKIHETFKYIIHVWWLWNKRRQLKAIGIYFFNEGISSYRKKKYGVFADHLESLNLKNKRLLIKMDIEGDEYKVLNYEFIKCLSCVDQLIVEFHQLDVRIIQVQQIVDRLKSDFELIHIHGNNFEDCFNYKVVLDRREKEFKIPLVVECTFLRKTSITQVDTITEKVKYPILGLDFPNNPSKQDIPLTFII